MINKIFYDGEKTIRPGYRSIEAYCFGVNHYGNPVIRAWQREGVSDTPYGDGYDKLKEKPGWRMFRLDGIKSFNNTNLKFDASADFLRQNRPRYNAHDRDMKQIYYALEPDGAQMDTRTDTSDSETTEKKPEGMFSGRKPLFKSSADKPLFGSERDENEKNSRINK